MALASSRARDAAETARKERRRNALVLVLGHLAQEGYVGALAALQASRAVPTNRIAVRRGARGEGPTTTTGR